LSFVGVRGNRPHPENIPFLGLVGATGPNTSGMHRRPSPTAGTAIEWAPCPCPSSGVSWGRHFVRGVMGMPCDRSLSRSGQPSSSWKLVEILGSLGQLVDGVGDAVVVVSSSGQPFVVLEARRKSSGSSRQRIEELSMIAVMVSVAEVRSPAHAHEKPPEHGAAGCMIRPTPTVPARD